MKSSTERLKRYLVRSGSMKLVHECPYLADAEAIAFIVLEEASMKGLGPLGELMVISGEQFGRPGGDEEIYISTTAMLKRMGRMK